MVSFESLSKKKIIKIKNKKKNIFFFKQIIKFFFIYEIKFHLTLNWT